MFRYFSIVETGADPATKLPTWRVFFARGIRSEVYGDLTLGSETVLFRSARGWTRLFPSLRAFEAALQRAEQGIDAQRSWDNRKRAAA